MDIFCHEQCSRWWFIWSRCNRTVRSVRFVGSLSACYPINTWTRAHNWSVLTTLRATKPAISSKEGVYRKIKSIDLDTFRNDLAFSELYQETHKEFNELVECYNNTLTYVLDKHAPLQRKIFHQRKRVPRYSEQILAAKKMRSSKFKFKFYTRPKRICKKRRY